MNRNDHRRVQRRIEGRIRIGAGCDPRVARGLQRTADHFGVHISWVAHQMCADYMGIDLDKEDRFDKATRVVQAGGRSKIRRVK